MRYIFSLFVPSYPKTLVYMLQTSEYSPTEYLRWYHRVTDFSKVAYRKKLAKTKAADLLLAVLLFGMLLQLVSGLILVEHGYSQSSLGLSLAGLILVLTYPIVWAYIIVVPLLLGRYIIVLPRQRALIAKSELVFRNHPATKIAVEGSYGKTTVKELLKTVLGEYKNVAATPGNKNVAISHALFAQSLKGSEEVLIIEYGEGQPGDIARFAQVTHPNLGIITGLAPAHLDHYPDVSAVAADLFSLRKFLDPAKIYVNVESAGITKYIKGEKTYSSHEVNGWKISNIRTGLDGTRFSMKKAKEQINVHSQLIGEHLVGPLALTAVIARQQGMTIEQIEKALAKTVPFEHRMQPRNINGGWIIDDTYNGTIEGMKAGLRLLHGLDKVGRKIYVTPGLVDQGEQSKEIHQQLGQYISQAGPDEVVLMQNSVVGYIQAGLQSAGFKGKVRISEDPLRFYTNIEHMISAGDVVLMQNDWPDNYN